MNGLPPGQQKMVEAIRVLTKRLGYPPTVRELSRELGLKSINGCADQLNALQKKGVITKEDGKSRTIRVVEEEEQGADAEYLEEIAKGHPYFTAEEVRRLLTSAAERACGLPVMTTTAELEREVTESVFSDARSALSEVDARHLRAIAERLR